MRDPVPYIVAEPLPSNILEWHYVVTGPPDSPYAGGFYQGKVCMIYIIYITGKKLIHTYIFSFSTY